MAKLTKEQKIEMCKLRIEKGVSISELAKRYGILIAHVYEYVRKYRMHGEEAFRKQHRTFPLEKKPEIVRRALDGESKASLAIEYNLHRGMIDSWLKRYEKDGYNGLVDKKRGRPPAMKRKKTDIDGIADPKDREIKDIIASLNGAFKKHGNLSGLIFHSDQGWQYQMQAYRKALKDKGITQSMSRKGNCMDNGIMEQFFGKTRNEMFYGHEHEFPSLDDLKKVIDEYIEY